MGLKGFGYCRVDGQALPKVVLQKPGENVCKLLSALRRKFVLSSQPAFRHLEWHMLRSSVYERNERSDKNKYDLNQIAEPVTANRKAQCPKNELMFRFNLPQIPSYPGSPRLQEEEL